MKQQKKIVEFIIISIINNYIIILITILESLKLRLLSKLGFANKFLLTPILMSLSRSYTRFLIDH